MSATRFDQSMPELRQQFLKEFGDGDWHELDDIEILFGDLHHDPDSSPLDPEVLLQAMERGGVKIERRNVMIDLGAPHSVSGEWCEDLVPTAGFRVIRGENKAAPEPGTVDSINFPELPAQGPGPQFELTSEGVIDFAPASALDREGNNIERLRRLHPPLRHLACQSAGSLGAGNAPHAILVSRVKAYREQVDKDLPAVDFTVLYVEGVRLANADNSAREQITKGELPALDEADREALDTLLQLHGTFILSTAAGAELLAAERSYQRRPWEEREHRLAAIDFASSLQNRLDIITPDAAAFVRGATEEIGQGRNPERSDVVGTSTLQNVTIVLSAAAAVAALPIFGALLAGPPGAIAGVLTGLLAGEGLKKSTPFATVIAPIIAGLNHAANVDLEKYKVFLMSVGHKARRLARGNEQFNWLDKALDWVSGQRGAAAAAESGTNALSHHESNAVVEKVFGPVGYVSRLGEYKSNNYEAISVPVPGEESNHETSVGFDFVKDYHQRRNRLPLRWWEEFIETALEKSEDLFLVVSERAIGFELEPSAPPDPRIGIKKIPGYATPPRLVVFVDLSSLDRSLYEPTLIAAHKLLVELATNR